MKRSKLKLPFDAHTLYEQGILLTVLLALFYLLFETCGAIGAPVVILWWFWRTKDQSVVWFGLVLLAVVARSNLLHVNVGDIGLVTKVSDTYYLVDTGHGKLMVYSSEDVSVDALVRIYGTFQQPEDTPGFWRFSFSKWAWENGIVATVQDAHVVKVNQLPTLRYVVYKKIQTIDNEKRRVAYERLLLNMKDHKEESFLNDRGFSVTAILAFLDGQLRYLLPEKKRRNVVLVFGGFLVLFYCFPIAGIQALLFRYFDERAIEERKKVNFAIAVLLFIHPSAIRNPAFVMNLLFRHQGKERDVFRSVLLSSLYQSLVFHHIYPLEILLYTYLRMGLGTIWFLALLFFGLNLPVEYLYYRVGAIFEWFRIFKLSGSVIGFGLLLFWMLAKGLYKQHYGSLKTVSLLYVMLGLGLFHPLAEVTFLNVAQGDAILLRAPLNRCNILIDTGKASQWDNLDSFLEAKGITKIHRLFISHHDEDHDGSEARIVEKYHACVTDTHFDTMDVGGFCFYDLNTEKEDTNANSLTLLTEVNGLRFLFTGDIDQETETEIVHRIGSFTIDILKVAHHGSDTASSDLFLDTVQPKIAILSAGSYQLYHHPDIKVLDRLSKRHIPALLTREEGDISFLFISRFNVVFSTKKVAIIGV